MRKTKIICTLGPSTDDDDILRKLMIEGMNVARFNFSHGDHAQHKRNMERIMKFRTELNLPVATLLDTKGPEIRVKDFKNGKIELKPGQTFTLTTDEVEGDEKMVSITYKNLVNDVKPGNTILIDDGLIEMTVEQVSENKIVCRVVNGGPVSNHKGVNVPRVNLSMPYISEQDRADIIFGIENDFDFIAASFVRTADDVLEIRKILDEHGCDNINIISKIENMQGVENIDEIIRVSDGIMVARGDLGTEIPSEEVPHAQKYLINVARECGKIAITATEMLESMMDNNRPKRAETSDIANAVLDGTDAVMLSGETSIGKHPVETVQAMADICEVAERYANFDYISKKDRTESVQSSIAENVVESSNRLGGKLICAATMSGSTAAVISNLKPKAPILALCPDEKTSRSLALNWGVYGENLKVCNSTDEVLNLSVERAKDFMNLDKGDVIVLTGGFPNTAENRTTNLMKIEVID